MTGFVRVGGTRSVRHILRPAEAHMSGLPTLVDLKCRTRSRFAPSGRLDDLQGIAERLYAYTARPDGDGGCWLWRGAKIDGAYGKVVIARKTYRVSRLVLFAKVGRVLSEAEEACHACDNPPCINPAHLWLGTQRDNIRDAKSKGRLRGGAWPGRRIPDASYARGERQGSAKLTTANVLEVRRLSSLGVPQRALAKQFGVSRSMIQFIVHRKNWRHIPDVGVS